jgi:hypothetical protein
MTSGMRVIFDKKESSAREKGCKKGTKMCPFAPPMVSLKSVQVLENEWRGRRDSNPRPLP